MNAPRTKILTAVLTALMLCIALSHASAQQRKRSAEIKKHESPSTSIHLPYKKFGFTERQAAAYLLDRFAFGARPYGVNSVERVAEQGVERWLEEQLNYTTLQDTPLKVGKAEPELECRLMPYSSLWLSEEEVATTYLDQNQLAAQAKREGLIAPPQRDSVMYKEYQCRLSDFARDKGIHQPQEALDELYGQKLLRAVYARSQVVEVLTDFWFNHFNVSVTDDNARMHIMSYERDAIRPFVLGTFRQMLGATAKHPAMLEYLDNAQSTAPEKGATTTSMALEMLRVDCGADSANRAKKLYDEASKDAPGYLKQRKGINENYAREIMELHTLGVDGGYTQQDVTEAARVLTGWTVFPAGDNGKRLGAYLGEHFEKQRENQSEDQQTLGFDREGLFFFRANAHDATEKMVLGVKFAAGGGQQEGEQLLDMLARHPSTARFVATKFAKRFVSDAPPTALVERLARVFTETNGDLRLLARAVVESPEFWGKGLNVPTVREKIKSPFELVTSALRALDAEVQQPKPLVDWVRRLGQPIYNYQAPTGFPDRPESWINTGALLNRMNFGLALAFGKIKGTSIALPSLADRSLAEGATLQSAEDVIMRYAALLLPERDPKVMRALYELAQQPLERIRYVPIEQLPAVQQASATKNDKTLNAQAIGIILGSPEFQRR